MRMTTMRRLRSLTRPEDGITLIIAVLVMFVAGLLVVAAFTAADGDIQLSHDSTIQKQAVYASLAGIQEYQYHLEKEPDFWQTCEAPSSAVPENKYEHYEIKLLAANGKTACSTSEPFASMIESSGSAANTFRIESIGCAGKKEIANCTTAQEAEKAKHTDNMQVRRVVASFKSTGFLQFVYFTRYEDEDPALYSPKANCATYYEVKGVKRSSECELIEFVTGDGVKGPMHTDDKSVVCGSPEFGRTGRSTPDKVELNGGYVEVCGGGKPVFNTATKSYTVGKELIPPISDESLSSYVEPTYRFTGTTQLTLNGTTNKITVVNSKGEEEPPLNWPENGLIYVEAPSGGSCGYSYTSHGADGPHEKEAETNCANVYVHGTYSKSLTIAAADDVIIDGSTYPTSVAGSLGSEPSGTATLGLIATQFVRVYHPVAETYKANKSGKGGYSCNNGDNYKGSGICEYENGAEGCDAPNLTATQDKEAGGYGYGTQENIWIYAAILSTKNSFVVDNFNCGSQLGKLNVFGAIAQNFRGIVGTSGNTGYIKNYTYDERLATDEPPYFLQPLNTGWEVNRETASAAG
jgi:hypothetical protein